MLRMGDSAVYDTKSEVLATANIRKKVSRAKYVSLIKEKEARTAKKKIPKKEDERLKYEINRILPMIIPSQRSYWEVDARKAGDNGPEGTQYSLLRRYILKPLILNDKGKRE